MKPNEIKAILKDVSERIISPEDAFRRLSTISFEDLDFAKLDHHRAVRTGVPEVIFAPGKSDEQIFKIFEKMAKSGSEVLVTRCNKSAFKKIHLKYKTAKYNELAKIIYLAKSRKRHASRHTIAVVSAGTSDIPVAEEASLTAEIFGARVERIYDVGVAGIHRLLAHLDKLKQARVVIVVAGMEGALASVVGGLVMAPVVAVPTSVGYGASFGGVAALLAMLNSCSPGVTVVNIDNGFGAAMAAIKMIRQ
jgi:hypothetical protein